MNIKANDIRKGYVIKFRDRVVRVLSATHHTPGNLRAMVQADMKDVKTGANVNHRFRSDDTVEKLNVDFMNMEYLYAEGDSFVFMNSENYEQVFLNKEMIGEYAGFLLPNMKIVVSFIEGLPVSVELPPRVTLKVLETEPGIRNATATNVLKPAKMETGINVNVPAFISEGDTIVVSTETGEYMSRG
jgi:elongation factor P